MSNDQDNIIPFPQQPESPVPKKRADLTPPRDDLDALGRRLAFRVIKGGKSK